jgi:hypothetical protein
MSRYNQATPNSGGQDATETPTGSTSPVHQERIVQQENTNGELHLTCRKDPEHPGEWRCRPVSGRGMQKAVSSLTTPPVDTPPRKSDAGGSRTPDSEGVETWIRGNGETISVRPIEHRGKVLYEPVDIIPYHQPVDPQPTTMKTARHDPPAARSRLSRCGEGSKGSCTLPRTRFSTRVKQNDQARGEP